MTAAVLVPPLILISLAAAVAWRLATQRSRPGLPDYSEVEPLWAARQGDTHQVDVIRGEHVHPFPLADESTPDHGARF